MFKKNREPVFFFFSGKGGVGKTTIAAATALRFSDQGKKTLIISTDPAHSLSDSFDKKLGDEVRSVSKNLFAAEIDPKKSMSEYKKKFSPKIEKIEMLKNLGIGDMFDTAGLTPGIDEISAFDKFLHYMSSDEYDVIIFDSAPTGHALRFLSLPDVLDSWVGKMIKLRMKFSGMLGMFKKIMPFNEDNKDESGIETDYFEDMKKRIESAKIILSDPNRTEYNIVLIAEDMSILESERSLKVLDEYNIPVKTIIVNQLLPENPGCNFCTEKRSQQQKNMGVIKKKFSAFKIMTLPLFKKEIRGLDALKKVEKMLYGSKK
ncbi:MAG: ArsA family ATPase [Planctomycetota bacterium]|jgi:arsenite-transporting ATPase